jgi:hypothetical protein
MTLWHRFLHAIHWNRGFPETWVDELGRVMVGFRCECGELMQVCDTGSRRCLPGQDPRLIDPPLIRKG